MAYISFQPTDFFNTVLYNGTASQQAITGVGFAPDYTWIKRRQTNWHCNVDAVRGATKRVSSNVLNAEVTDATAVESLDANGFTVGIDSNGYTNQSGGTYVAWNWKAGTTSGITAGAQTITPSAYSINTTAGFGIYKWSRTGASTTDYFSHGLGATPTIAIQKRTDGAQDWYVNFTFLDGTMDYMNLNDTDSKYDGTTTLPTSTNWYAKSPETGDYITYLFVPKKGYSSFGTYDGSGQLDGPFIFTGFRPAYVMVKVTDDAVHDWYIWDNRRSPSGGYNAQQYRLMANEGDAEGTSANYIIDMVSNGFKLRDNNVGCNGNGNKFIYMAFAEFPLVSSNSKPGTAR